MGEIRQYVVCEQLHIPKICLKTNHENNSLTDEEKELLKYIPSNKKTQEKFTTSIKVDVIFALT